MGAQMNSQLSLLAGWLGGPGYADGTGLSTRFNRPEGIVGDSAGNLFVIDTNNAVIRKIDSSKTVSTFAGRAHVQGYLDGPATVAQFYNLLALGIDNQNNLWVADGAVIREISPLGSVETISGNPAISYVADGSLAQAHFSTITALVVDPSGNVFVADGSGACIREISAGIVVTVAGTCPGSAIPHPGSAAPFAYIASMAFDRSGNLYILDGGAGLVKMMTPVFALYSVAGGAPGTGEIDGTGSGARFATPSAIGLEADGNFLIADAGAIRELTPAGEVTTIAGDDFQPGNVNGDALTARFDGIQSIYQSPGGGPAYLVEPLSDDVRQFQALATSTLAGNPPPVDKSMAVAPFYGLAGVAVDGAGNSYVVELGGSILKITPLGVVTTIVGSGVGYVDGTTAHAKFSSPAGIAVDAAGNLYIADTGNFAIRKVAADGTVSTVAGGATGSSGLDGPVAAARFLGPQALSLDSAGNLYVADSTPTTLVSARPAAAVRVISTTGVVSTLAGSLTATGTTDGASGTALFTALRGITMDSGGNALVTDGDSVRRITSAGAVTTIAGMTGSTTTNALGNGATARFSSPTGLVVDASGAIYLADTGNDEIKRIDQTGNVTLYAGNTSFSGNLPGSLPATLAAVTGLALSSNGLVTTTPYAVLLTGPQ